MLSMKRLMVSLGVGLCSLVLAFQAYSNSYYSVNFSKKNQVRTSLIWIQLKSSLIEARYRGEIYQEMPADSFEVSAATVDMGPPFDSVGRLFYTIDGNVASCTGFFSGASQVVMTAADCVMSPTGEWYGDFLYIHSYGTERKAIFAVECIGVFSEWAEAGAGKPSFAALKVDRASTGSSLSLTEAPPPSELIVLGYPRHHKKGFRMVATQVPAAGDVPYPAGALEFDTGSIWTKGSTAYAMSQKFAEFGSDGDPIPPAVLPLSSYVSNGCRSR